jgi:hypothetical protein
MPPSINKIVFPETNTPEHLAYVEWYTKFSNYPNANHGMYKVSLQCNRNSSLKHGIGSIIPVSDIVQSVHLFPFFGPYADAEWTSKNVLDLCKNFFVNLFTDKSLYRLIG